MLFNLIVFITGLIFGSFLNVMIYRIPRKESIVFPASHCPECMEELGARDLIPVFSYIIKKGKCSYCGEKISLQYPVVELLTGFLLLLLFIKNGFNSEFFIYSLLFMVLIVVSFIDLKYMIIPNKITYPAFVIALVLAMFFGHIGFISALLGAFIPAALFLVIALFYGKGLGMGDVKLVAVIGAVIGWEYTLLGISLGSILALLIILPLMFFRLIDRKTRIPFGPIISIGVIITVLYGQEIFAFLINNMWKG
ncbi:MAG: prepilin peptidase [Halanaerobiales bacterium]